MKNQSEEKNESSFQEQILAELRELKEKVRSLEEENAHLRREMAKLQRPERKLFDKDKLEALVRQGKTNKQLAKQFGVCERTIARKVSQYGLTGLRKKKAKRPRKDAWVSVKRYMDELNRKYNLQNYNYPGTRFINPRTRACSNERHDPEGTYTTANIYYVVLNSDAYIIYSTTFRVSADPIPFEDIYEMTRQNALDYISNLWLENPLIIEEIIAYTFYNPEDKPNEIIIEGGVDDE